MFATSILVAVKASSILLRVEFPPLVYLSVHIRLGWKFLTVTSTVDLDWVESIVAVKRFRVQALRDCKKEFVTDSHLPSLESEC